MTGAPRRYRGVEYITLRDEAVSVLRAALEARTVKDNAKALSILDTDGRRVTDALDSYELRGQLYPAAA